MDIRARFHITKPLKVVLALPEAKIYQTVTSFQKQFIIVTASESFRQLDEE